MKRTIDQHILDIVRQSCTAILPNGPAPYDDEVRKLEQELAVRFPSAFAELLGAFGGVRTAALELLSFDEIVNEAVRLRGIDPGFPKVLVPLFRDLATSHLACVVGAGEACGDLVLVDASDARELAILARSPDEAIRYRLAQVIEHDYFIEGLANFVEHSARIAKFFKYDRVGGGRLAPERQWRCYRSCVQDVVISITVLRFDRVRNCIEVDVFLTAEVAELEVLCGARAAAMLILGEAIRCGTNLEIRFTENVEGGRVPLALRALGETLGVSLGVQTQEAISPTEASALFRALAGLVPSGALEETLRSDPEIESLACHAILQNTWTPIQLEILAAGGSLARTLTGSTPPWDRLLNAIDEQSLRAAMLAGAFVRACGTELGADSDNREDTELVPTVAFDATHGALLLQQDEGLEVPWGASFRTERLAVFLRPAGEALVEEELLSAFGEAHRLRAAEGMPEAVAWAVATTSDITLLPEQGRSLIEEGERRGVHVLVCPDAALGLQSLGQERIRRSRKVVA